MSYGKQLFSVHIEQTIDAYFNGALIMSKQKRVALYARVSTDAQTTENQLLELRAMAEWSGWTVVAEFVDRGIRG